MDVEECQNSENISEDFILNIKTIARIPFPWSEVQ
jgi:hypothetical protein